MAGKKVRAPEYDFIYNDIGHYRTTSLFLETANFTGITANSDPKYTFMPEDTPDGLKSVHKIYMESANEYEAAIKIFGTWEAWEHITESINLKQYFAQLRKAKAAKEYHEVRQVLYEAAVIDKNITAASKLFEYYNKGAKGRPSQQSVNKAAREIAQDESVIKHANKVVRELRN